MQSLPTQSRERESRGSKTLWRSPEAAPLVTPAPVSYTHLDVYKRQTMAWMSEYARPRISPGCTAQSCCFAASGVFCVSMRSGVCLLYTSCGKSGKSLFFGAMIAGLVIYCSVYDGAGVSRLRARPKGNGMSNLFACLIFS